MDVVSLGNHRDHHVSVCSPAWHEKLRGRLKPAPHHYLFSSTTSASMTSSFDCCPAAPDDCCCCCCCAPAPADWYITSASLCEAFVRLSVARLRLSMPPCSIALRASLMAASRLLTSDPEILSRFSASIFSTL